LSQNRNYFKETSCRRHMWNTVYKWIEKTRRSTLIRQQCQNF